MEGRYSPTSLRYAGDGKMKEKDKEYIRMALKDFHNSMEDSLSRVISKEEQGADGFMHYITLMNEIREYARKRSITLKQAARELSR